ncbi:MAG: nucleotide pyrophosphohydrolase [Chitinophagales bacterium]|nr:nucleotide pyrophosphohydrolase [Chitinophagales bacterium]
MQIAEAQKQVDDWIKQYGVRYFNELTNLSILMEEVGELARIFSRKYGEQSFKNKEENLDVGDELADILFVLICIANQTNINLEEVLARNLMKKTQRDKERHFNNNKLK